MFRTWRMSNRSGSKSGSRIGGGSAMVVPPSSRRRLLGRAPYHEALTRESSPPGGPDEELPCGLERGGGVSPPLVIVLRTLAETRVLRVHRSDDDGQGDHD